MLGIRQLGIIVITALITVLSKKLPDNFFGTYTLEKTNNFNEYLVAKEYRWLTRTIIIATHVTKIIRKADSGLPYHYDIDTLTWKKNVLYRDIELGKTFESEHLEDGDYMITVDFDNDTLTETLVGINFDPPYEETFNYTREGDYLIMKTEWGGIEAEGFYKKVAS